MAFDLASARPVATPAAGGFDLASATPVRVIPTAAPVTDNGGTFLDNLEAGIGRASAGIKNAVLDPAAGALSRSPVGKFLDDIGQKIGLPSTAEANANTQKVIDEAKQSGADKNLMHTWGGNVGNIATNALAAYGAGAAAKAMPGVNALVQAAGRAAPYITGAAVGAGQGYADPTATGESKTGNVVTGAVVGAASPVIAKGIGSLGSWIADKAKSAYQDLQGAAPDFSAAADKIVRGALQKTGATVDQLGSAFNDIKTEVANALGQGKELDPQALARKVDILAVGGKPTLGAITRDPQQFAKEKLLSGIDGAGAPLADAANKNNAAFIGTLNKAGAANATDSYTAGKTLQQATQDWIDTQRNGIGDLYDAARDSSGRPALLDAKAFNDAWSGALDKSMKGAFLPTEVRDTLNKFASGDTPLDVQHAEVFKTILSTAQRAAKDGNAKEAIGVVQNALNNTPLMAEGAAARTGAANALPNPMPTTTGPSAGQQAIDAFNKARQAFAQHRSTVESTPALSAIDNADNPGMLADSFFDKQVVKTPAAGLKANLSIWQQSPEAMQALKGQTLDWLKAKALNGASDETGNFSQSAYNKALEKLGDQKLGMIFTPQEVAQLKTLGRAASYVQAQPPGSVVNNSGTAAQAANLLMRYATPTLHALQAPFASVANSLAARQAASAATPAMAPVAASAAGPILNRLVQMGTPAAALQLLGR